MKLLIYGAGAVGRYLGGMLAQAGHDVTLVVRPEGAAVLQAEGLTITDPATTVMTRPHIVTSLRQAMLNNLSYDAFLLTMKAYSVNQTIDEMIAFCPHPPPLVTLQNGIGIEEQFQQQFPQTTVIAGSVTTPVTLKSDNEVLVEKSGRGVGVAHTQPKGKIGPWQDLFQSAGIKTVSVKNYKSLKWSKTLLNIVGNASSAILNRHPGVVYQSEAMYLLELAAIRETLKVMARLKLEVVNLPGAPAWWLAFGVKNVPSGLLKPILTQMVTRGRGDKMPSFALDLTAGKKQSEVLYHNGAIAKAGRELGIPTPVNTALTDILLKLARQELDWHSYSGNVKQLVAEINRYS
jgi:2-dehydropantoate 2-reductase